MERRPLSRPIFPVLSELRGYDRYPDKLSADGPIPVGDDAGSGEIGIAVLKPRGKGRKQVWRRFDGAGVMADNIITAEGDLPDGKPLIKPRYAKGRALFPGALSDRHP